MTETSQNTTNKAPEYDPIDRQIINIVTAEPDINNTTIANKLVNIGTYKTIDGLFKRLSRKDYLSRDIEQIRANHREQISRELMPEALKVTRKALKDKTMSAKDKHPYVAMIVKSDLGDQGADTKPQVINIEHLERMQVIMGSK